MDRGIVVTGQLPTLRATGLLGYRSAEELSRPVEVAFSVSDRLVVRVLP